MGLAAELLVIDNGSTDDTKVVVERSRFTNMTLRYVQEPRIGQCYARNTGLGEARGDLIIFTDDDVRVPVDWIISLAAPILSGRQDFVSGSVRIRRAWNALGSQGRFETCLL